ncbi:hypothetical protein H0X48_05435 [Candidatus Dependentiae bacterium]|nr:hypothetical protein [Candidatus Dependentiae bacterium]
MKKKIFKLLFFILVITSQAPTFTRRAVSGRQGFGTRPTATTFGATGTTQFSAVSPQGITISQKRNATTSLAGQIANYPTVRQNSYNFTRYSRNYKGRNRDWQQRANPNFYYQNYLNTSYYPDLDYNNLDTPANYQDIYPEEVIDYPITSQAQPQGSNALAQQLYPDKDTCIRACLDITVDTLQSCLVQCGAS